MNTAHTPGQWATAELAPTEVVIDDDRVMVATARYGMHNGISREEAIANARLIAAAPELLAALNELVNATLISMPHDPVWVAAAHAKARAAIAKATGKQQ